MKNRLENIENFFISHGWEKRDRTKQFDFYYPPDSLELPRDFYLEVPSDQNDKGFQRYTEGLIDIIEDIYVDKYPKEDIKVFFSSEKLIFSLQIIDNDTKLGTIRLERLKNAFNNMYTSIKQSVIFSVTNLPIFGNAKYDIAQYMRYCRGLQTDIGSYVVKFELPENHLTLMGERSIPNMLFDTIAFLTEITNSHEVTDINLEFIQKYKELINIELFEAIVKLYKEAELQNANIRLDSNQIAREHHLDNIRNNLGKTEILIKSIKDFILQTIPLETRGHIFRLSSKDPTHGGVVWIEAEIADEKQIIEVRLKSENYFKAVESHKNGYEIYLKGIARQTKSKYLIENIQEFEIK